MSRSHNDFRRLLIPDEAVSRSSAKGCVDLRRLTKQNRISVWSSGLRQENMPHIWPMSFSPPCILRVWLFYSIAKYNRRWYPSKIVAQNKRALSINCLRVVWSSHLSSLHHIFCGLVWHSHLEDWWWHRHGAFLPVTTASLSKVLLNLL